MAELTSEDYSAFARNVKLLNTQYTKLNDLNDDDEHKLQKKELLDTVNMNISDSELLYDKDNLFMKSLKNLRDKLNKDIGGGRRKKSKTRKSRRKKSRRR